jgi:hypothetical protein
MNTRLEELAEKTGVTMLNVLSCYEEEIKCFAELVAADERAAMLQAITDPENQPSQFGTVTVEYMEQEINRRINNKVT